MNLTSQTFIERPIATSLLMAAIALFGGVAYRQLPVSDLPNVDFPTLLVTASLPGASPETMASAVATPLENQFSTIAGLNSMSSSNSLGNTQITLEFDLARKLDGAAVDVQAAITQASRLLPPGMPTPPTFTKVNPADQPILYIALTSPTLPLWTLDEYAETRIAQRISMVSGVAQVQVLGAQKYAVHVQMDPHALASRQIGINEVETALKNWNVNLPTGAIIGPQRAFTLQASGQLLTAEQYRPVVVAYRNGSPVRLDELGTILDSVEDDKTASWFYKDKFNSRAIVLAIQRQPGTNTIVVTSTACRTLPLPFKTELPPSVAMNILYDRSETIRESYKDVQFTMLLTLGLVVMVIFLFLRNVSATIIPSLALPFSIVGTFAVMYLLNYSLDNLSMMALILSIGFVVDDAIVMLENIVRHIETRRGAAGGGAQRLARNRLHHRLDDAVARGRVHPRALPGRRAGTAVQGIRRHHLRGHPDFGRGLRHPDSHAVQPLPARLAGNTKRGWFLFRVTEYVFSSGMLHAYDVTRQNGLRLPRGRLGLLSRCWRRNGLHVHATFPRASSPIRIPIRSWPSPRRRRALPITR